MSIKETYKQMKELLGNIAFDLDKSENGNKAASQRVRTGTVTLEKVAKVFRKESIAVEKKNKDQKKGPKAGAGAPKKGKASAESKEKSSSSKGKADASPAKSKTASFKAKPKPKMAQLRASAKPSQFTVKRATAKLPTKPLNRI